MVQATQQEAAQLLQNGEIVSVGVQTAASSVTEMRASVSEIARNAASVSQEASQAVRLAQEAKQTVNTLDKSSTEIGGILDTISSIAEQTNLLALNATIEAARAGEAGKGFAVVANEVKELAGQTALATDEISQRGAIQGDTVQAVRAIEGVAKVIDEINESQSTIGAAIEEQSATSDEVAQAMEQASSSLDEITRSANALNDVVQQTQTSVVRSQKVVSVLEVVANELDGMITGHRAAEHAGVDSAEAPSHDRGDRFGMDRVRANGRWPTKGTQDRACDRA